MHQLYSVKAVCLSSGERLPLLIDRATGLPHGQVADYILATFRGDSINTSKRSVSAVGMFHSWAKHREIDLDRRFGSGDLFTSDETTALSEALWERRFAELAPSKRYLLEFTESVVGATHGHRSDQVIAYIKWRTSQIVSSMSVHDIRVGNINRRLELVVEQLKSNKGKSTSIPRGQLDPNQCLRLFEILRPGSPDNPFHEETQLRNFFIVLLYYELGVRKAEPLAIKGVHLKFGPRPLITITFTPNDPKDPRRDQPRVKTVSRTLPMSPLLATTTDRLLKQRSTSEKIKAEAKRWPFVVLDIDKGRPLSLDAVYDIFVVLRRRFPNDFPPNFAAHHLRRSWNHRFSQACKEARIDAKMEDHIRRYIMGWSKTSTQPANYNRKEIEEQAFRLLLSMQDNHPIAYSATFWLNERPISGTRAPLGNGRH